MPRPPRIRTYEFICPTCGKVFIEQDVEAEEEFPRSCSTCLMDGVVSYYTRNAL